MSSTVMLGVFSASLVSSLHCAGMCGGLAAFATSKSPGPRRLNEHSPPPASSARHQGLTAQVCYNGGRLVGYLILGAGAGLFGAGIDAAGQFAGVGRAATLVSAVLMIGWAVWTLAPIRVARSGAARPLKIFSKALGKASELPGALRALVVGLGTGLLPCGLLYAFVLAASGAGSALGGAGVMLAFWLGTVPVLLGLGTMTRFVGERVLHKIPLISAWAILLIGLSNLYTHFNIPAKILSQLSNPHEHRGSAGSVPKCH